MAEAAAHGGMDIKDQKETFSAFVHVALWSVVLIMATLALLVTAFAANLGWFAGLGAFIVVGAGLGLLANMGGAWWATLIGMSVLLGLGGGLVALLG